VLCYHSNATRAPIANPPNSAQLRDIPYHSSKLHPIPCNNAGMRPRTDTYTQTHRRAWPQYISRRLRITRNVKMRKLSRLLGVVMFDDDFVNWLDCRTDSRVWRWNNLKVDQRLSKLRHVLWLTVAIYFGFLRHPIWRRSIRPLDGFFPHIYGAPRAHVVCVLPRQASTSSSSSSSATDKRIQMQQSQYT